MNININSISPQALRWFITVTAALLFIPFLGGVHLFDWDEINFAESAREMIITGDYLTVQINYQPFWEKPPLFIWMQVLSMKLFGINEFAARFPNAVCGIITLLVLFNIGRKLRDNLFGMIWVLAYAGSVLPFFYFKSGIIDPWFNLFIFLGVYYLMKYLRPDNPVKQIHVVLSAIFSGLAVLTKGPAGILLIALTGGIYLILTRFWANIRTKDVVLFFIVLLLTGGSWFILQMASGHSDTVADFILYQIRLFRTQDAGHGGFFGYHFVVLFIGVFPSSIFALKAFKREQANAHEPDYGLVKKWMIILFWVVLVLFSIVKTKIVHYSSLAYFPLSFLAASFIYSAHLKQKEWSKWISITILFISVLIALPVLLLQFVDKFKYSIISSNIINDDFAVENLKADVYWSGYEFLPGAIFLLIIILVFRLIKNTQPLKRALYLWTATILFVLSVLIIHVPKIEHYSQNALVEFFKSKAGKDVYLKNLHFKSYATWFYGKVMPPGNNNYYNQEWLLSGDIDKDVFFVTKIHRAHLVEQYPDVNEIDRKNGFVFYERKIKK